MLAMTSEEAEAKAPSRDRPQGARRRLPVRQDAGRLRLLLPAPPYPGPSWTTWPRCSSDAAENVVLVGSPGVGKTHIAVALGVEAVRARKEVRFTDRAALVRDLKDASRAHPGEEGEVLRPRDAAHHRRAKVPGRGTRRGPTCCSSSSRPATSTAPRSSPPTWPWAFWADVLGDAVTAAAIADRVCHHCTMLKITGGPTA